MPPLQPSAGRGAGALQQERGRGARLAGAGVSPGEAGAARRRETELGGRSGPTALVPVPQHSDRGSGPRAGAPRAASGRASPHPGPSIPVPRSLRVPGLPMLPRMSLCLG